MTVDTVKALAKSMAGSAYDEEVREGIRFGGAREDHVDLFWRERIVPAQARIKELKEAS